MDVTGSICTAILPAAAPVSTAGVPGVSGGFGSPGGPGGPGGPGVPGVPSPGAAVEVARCHPGRRQRVRRLARHEREQPGLVVAAQVGIESRR